MNQMKRCDSKRLGELNAIYIYSVEMASKISWIGNKSIFHSIKNFVKFTKLVSK